MQGSLPYSLNQDNVEKMFYEQLKTGDYVDARFNENDWRLAKVIDRDNKCLSVTFDGSPPNI